MFVKSSARPMSLQEEMEKKGYNITIREEKANDQYLVRRVGEVSGKPTTYVGIMLSDEVNGKDQVTELPAFSSSPESRGISELLDLIYTQPKMNKNNLPKLNWAPTRPT
ncbi:hypothetical protein FQA39_LY07970 [Lamprigera yunnana]|nr:hypothetical protein FQA39_LY07970 [Lamprigera yunnana]